MHMSYVENESFSCFDCHLFIREGRWSFKARTNWHVFVQGRIMQHIDIYKWIIKYSYMYYLILTEPLKNIWLSKSKLTNLVRINSHPVRTNIHPLCGEHFHVHVSFFILFKGIHFVFCFNKHILFIMHFLVVYVTQRVYVLHKNVAFELEVGSHIDLHNMW